MCVALLLLFVVQPGVPRQELPKMCLRSLDQYSDIKPNVSGTHAFLVLINVPAEILVWGLGVQWVQQDQTTFNDLLSKANFATVNSALCRVCKVGFPSWVPQQNL